MQQMIAAFVLGALLVSAAPVRADFLGLAPGDYIFTLNGTASVCGSNCTGTVHIGASGFTDFDWNFVIAGITFDWDPFVDAKSLASPAEDCAIESDNSASFLSCFPPVGLGHLLLIFLARDEGNRQGATLSNFVSVGGSNNLITTWSATRVPEPTSLSLLGFGALALFLRRRRLS